MVGLQKCELPVQKLDDVTRLLLRQLRPQFYLNQSHVKLTRYLRPWDNKNEEAERKHVLESKFESSDAWVCLPDLARLR